MVTIYHGETNEYRGDDYSRTVDVNKGESALALRSIRTSFIYHFFPHYRYGVIKELASRLDATFVSDRDGAEGIKPYVFNEGEKFQFARCYYLGRFAFQPAAVTHCWRARQDVFVFLASPNHITTWIAALVARLRGRRVIFWGHGFKSSDRGLKNLVRRAFFGIAHAFYTYGWRAKQNAISLGAKEENIHVGFNSLNYVAQLPLRQALIEQSGNARNRSVVRIFCVSRLTAACRYDMLLEAVALLAGNGVHYSITFVGDGPARGALESQARNLRVDATFFGAIYDEARVASLAFDADVTVSPGKVGLTAMHSLMFGTPVLTNSNFISQMPEVEAIVPGFTGDFFTEGSVQDLAAKLGSFSERFPDRKLTQSRCFAMVDQIYNPKRQAEIMLRAIQGLPANRGDDAFVLFEGPRA